MITRDMKTAFDESYANCSAEDKLSVYENFFKDSANYKFWNYINEMGQLSNEFVRLFSNNFPSKYWKTQARKLVKHDPEFLKNTKFIEEFAPKFDWEVASKEITKHKVIKDEDEALVREFSNYFYWKQLSKVSLSEKLIDDYNDKVDWEGISMHSPMSEDFLRKYDDKINFDLISEWQRLTESFINDYADKLNWHKISKRQKLSISFMWKHINDMDWDIAAKCQKLSLDLIDSVSDVINWNKVSRYQVLTEDFIEKHADQVNWNNIYMYQDLSEEFKALHADKYNPKEPKLKKKGKGVRAQTRKMAAKAIVEDEKRKERGFTTHCENFKYSKRPSTGKSILRNEQQLRDEKSIIHRSSGRTFVKPGDRYTPGTYPTIAK
jgi:hypothetical protein